MKRRVVITGMGVITPIGLNTTDFAQSLKQGVCGEKNIESFDTSHFPVKQAYEVRGFNPRPQGTHFLDPFIQYAVAASEEALQMAGFDPESVDPFRVGMSVSSSKGGVHTLDRFRARFEKHPSAILGSRIYSNSVPNFAAQWIARRWKLKGAAKCYIAACATGTVAVSEGAQMVADGMLDYCLAGASDASVVPLMLAGYQNMKVLSKTKMRPFDQNRDGFKVGEGAGILFLETLESAKARGAKIYAEVLGWHYGCDGTSPTEFDPNQNALARTLSGLLQRTELKPEDIDYFNLHGTGTRAGDAYETQQIKQAFGAHASRIPMSSIKSMTGHMLGASGAVEIIASVLAMDQDFVPSTIGLETPAPDCDLNYTPGRAKTTKIKTAVSHSMGFGGHVAALALKSIECL